jgi:hypothetical protein
MVAAFFFIHVGTEKELIMVGSTGTVQNDGTLKIKNGGLRKKIVEGLVQKQERKFLASTNGKRSHSYIK